MTTPRLTLYTTPGAFDFPSIDPDSLVAASYLQLLRPNGWNHFTTSDPGSSPNGCLPYLSHGPETFSSAAILPHLLRSSESVLSPLQESESVAFHSLLDTTVLPLVLHSLYSLPQNWTFLRPHLSASLPFPTRYYRPEQLRTEAEFVVTSHHPDWWGLGGDAEKEDAMERRRKKVLLEAGTEAWKERKEEERKESKERVKKTFGEGKITSAARQVFTALESTLASSSTPFFFSSSSPTPLDTHLSSLLSLILYIPLPLPLLSNLINSSFPRLWTHSALMRRTLWSESGDHVAPVPRPMKRGFNLIDIVSDFVPTFGMFGGLMTTGTGTGTGIGNGQGKGNGRGKGKGGKKTKSEEEFERKRLIFAAIVLVGVVGWGLGTGAIPLPGRPGIWATDDDGDEDEEEGEYEVEVK